MAQVNQQRLDAQFPFDDEAGVQMGLRLLTKVVEARLAELEAQRAGVDGVVDDLTKIALGRIDEVLTPSLLIIQQLIALGFPSERITDSGFLGRQLISAKDRAEFFDYSGAASRDDVAAALATANQNITGVQNSLNLTANKLNAILAGADPLFDTFVELVARMQNDEAGLTSVLAALQNRLRIDAAQGLTAAQQSQGLANLGLSDPLRYGAQSLSGAQQSQARANIGAVDAGSLAFVRRAGGGAQNDVKMFWDGGRLQAVVDALSLGYLWCDANAGRAFAQQGYHYLPSNFLFQWGTCVGGDTRVYFPVAFPNNLLNLQVSPDFYPQPTECIVANSDQRDRTGFALRSRYVNGGAVQYSQGVNHHYFAVGF